MDTDFSFGPLDYWSAEFKRNLNGYHLAHGYYFIAHGSQIFSSGPFIFWTRIARIKRIFPSGPLGYSIRTVNPCPSVCPKHSIFERFVFKERIRVYLCLSVCQKYSIRVQRKSVFKKAVRPSPTHQCRTQADHLYLIQYLSHFLRLWKTNSLISESSYRSLLPLRHVGFQLWHNRKGHIPCRP